MISKNLFEGSLGSAHATLFWESEHQGQERAAAEPPRFVTISRQAGAGGRSLARLLADKLSDADPGPRPWSAWDRELVEKIAADQHIPPSAIEALETPRSWLEELLGGLSLADHAEALDQFRVFRRVVATARALARAGRAILVGRGGVYATRDLPGGVHIRLVAPLEFRVANFARVHGVTEAEAARQVHHIDQEREAFHRRYRTGKALLPELFTVTFNTADVWDERLVASVLPLVLPERSEPAATTRVGATCAVAGN
jgi:hypothetical protein